MSYNVFGGTLSLTLSLSLSHISLSVYQCAIDCWLQRAALTSQNLTKVTLETFLKWKERKVRSTASHDAGVFV